MKKVSLFSLAFAALMLGACSSENELVNQNDGAEWNAEGTGYVNLAIQLPTQPSNRGVSLDDGTPAEYEVNNATLILFTGTSQSNAVINSAYEMDLNFSPEGSTNQITTTSKITQKINEISSQAGNIYALVVLNNNDLFTVTSDNDLKIGEELQKTKTLAKLNKNIKDNTSSANWHGAGFLMSNAPMANAVGGLNSVAALVGPLVEIDHEKIHPTKEEAAMDPAASIYVERAEAKVTLKNGSDGSADNVTINGSTGTTASFVVLGWDIDNYNTTNKLVRSVSSTEFAKWKRYSSTNLIAPNSPDYRFIGTTEIASNLYRVYWGDDYNYSGDAQLSRTSLTSLKTANGEDAAYCFENTTDMARMLEKNLTRVIVKVQFNGGTSFYTLDGDNTVIWSEDNTKKEILNRLLLDVNFAAWAKDAVKAGQTLDASKDLSFEFSAKDGSNDGSYEVKNITLTESGQEKLKNGKSLLSDVVLLANKHIKLTYYPQGIAYYPIYIKHFGDDQTPWSKETADPSNIYGTSNQENNYLGRYGVLRNNWYDITVNSIKTLGTPVIENPGGDPVDKKESYLSVTINILSWAKRTQDVDL